MKQFKVTGMDVSDWNEKDRQWFCVYFETLDGSQDETIEGYVTSCGMVHIEAYQNWTLADMVIDQFDPYNNGTGFDEGDIVSI